MPFIPFVRDAATVAGALAALLSATPAVAATETECLVGCVGGGGCRLKNTRDARELTPEDFKVERACEAWTVEKGQVLLRYRRERKWFQPPPLGNGADKNLSTVLGKYPADEPCSVPTSRCLQMRMSEKVAAAGGHGVDSQAAAPAGTHEPCALGLPCGTVLPPVENWSFRLADAAFDGRWQVRIARGAPPAGVPAAFELPVAAGVVRGDGRRFNPGSVYAYDLVDAGGRAVASGEFAVMSSAATGRLKAVAARRVDQDGMSAATAWIDALGASELDWDAQQLLQAR